MELVKKVFVWNSGSGQFPWNVGLAKDRIVGRLQNVKLAQDFAERLLGKPVEGFIGQGKSAPCFVDEHAKVLMEEPAST